MFLEETLRRSTITRSPLVSTPKINIRGNIYVFPVRRPLARPARRREERRELKELGQTATTSQERMLGTAEDISSLLGPNLCWRNPPATAKMMGGMS